MQEYLRAGDVYQVNLARRLRARCRGDRARRGWRCSPGWQAQRPAPHALWLADPTAAAGR